jgi:membrane-bound lytic murein transglycosylase D
VDSARLAWLQTPTTLQELVGDRMSCFETAAPHQFNNAVMAYVRLFTERQRGYTQRVLERRDFYFPLFEKYLAQYHLPDELKYLSVVESALLPAAKSGVGAVGLWQFMPPTANDLRLKRDEWVDERMHPEKATEAACRYLRSLYNTFHDWELVLAAYNWGTGNVQRVIRRTGKRNFWDMYPHMPAETRNYVPTFTAIMYAMTYAKEHDLHSPALRYQHYEQLDTLTLRGQALDLRRLSRALGYSDSLALLRYNPELRRAGLPAGYRPYVLRFPAAAREHLGAVDHATLLAYCQPAAELPRPLTPVLARLTGVEPWLTNAQLAHAATEEAAPRYRRLTYTLRRGQTLATVAAKYQVSPAQLRKWNGLRKDQALKPGRQIVVVVPVPAPTPPRTEQTMLAVASTPPVTVATLRRTVPTDSTLQTLAAANALYARQAQERTAREVAQAQELARMKKQLAARAAAQRRLSIAQAAAAAKNVAATRLGLSTDSVAANTSVATMQPQPARTAKLRESLRATAARQPETNNSLATANVAPVPEEAMAALRPGRPQPETRRPREEKTEVTAALYTIRPGDNLTKLAQEHDVSIEQLKAWNKLTTETVLAGQQLRLAAPADATALPVAVQTAAPHRAKNSPGSPKLETHTVQPGDTLFSIAKRFGLTLTELKRLNHLAGDQVKLGQKLVVGG